MGAHNYLVHGPHLIPILEINKLRRPAHSWAVAELFRARVYLTRRLNVRSFLYLLYTLIKLYFTKALSDLASSLVPD